MLCEKVQAAMDHRISISNVNPQSMSAAAWSTRQMSLGPSHGYWLGTLVHYLNRQILNQLLNSVQERWEVAKQSSTPWRWSTKVCFLVGIFGDLEHHMSLTYTSPSVMFWAISIWHVKCNSPSGHHHVTSWFYIVVLAITNKALHYLPACDTANI